MCLWTCMHTCVGLGRGQMRVSNTLELELQVFVSHLMPRLGTKPGSSGRTGGANHCTIFPARQFSSTALGLILLTVNDYFITLFRMCVQAQMGDPALIYKLENDQKYLIQTLASIYAHTPQIQNEREIVNFRVNFVAFTFL